MMARFIYWTIIAFVLIASSIISMVLAIEGSKKVRADDCIPPRVQGPTIGTKVGGEYGQLSSLKDHQVILTFDDGPSPNNTQKIQDILKKNCISAVFFPIGENAERNPDLVKMIVANGHVVGSHTWSHIQPFKAFLSDVQTIEINKGVKTINDITPEARPYFRYPGLSHNNFTEQYTTKQGLTVWSGDVDPHDYAQPGTGVIIQRILSQLKTQHNQGIIILHENHATTAMALPAIIAALREQKYQIVGVK